MRICLAALLSGGAFAGIVHAAPQAEPQSAPAAAPRAYIGAGAGLMDGGKVGPKLFGGYAFNNKLALETGAIDFRQGYGLYIAVKPTVALTAKLSAYGKVGAAQRRARAPLPAAALPVAPLPVAPAAKKSDTGAYGAFGLQYSITPNSALTTEYERYGKDKRDGAGPGVWAMALRFLF